MLDKQALLSRPEWVYDSIIDGEHMLLHTETSDCFRLNAIGSDIWSRIAEPKSYQRLLDELLAEYDINIGVCEPDVEQFIDELRQRGLIEVLTAN